MEINLKVLELTGIENNGIYNVWRAMKISIWREIYCFKYLYLKRRKAEN